MELASCRCFNGHEFTTRIIENDPDINSLVLAADEGGCPECGTDEFTVTNIYFDED